MKFHLQKTVVLEVPKEEDLRLDTFAKEDIQRLSTALKKAGIYHRIEVSDKKSSVLIYDQTFNLSEHCAFNLFKYDLSCFFEIDVSLQEFNEGSEFLFKLELHLKKRQLP